MKKTNTQNNIGLFIGIGTSIGISLGVAFGSIFDNIGLGISLGISFGAGIAIVFWSIMQKINDKKDNSRISKNPLNWVGLFLVGVEGFEPPTSTLSR